MSETKPDSATAPHPALWQDALPAVFVVMWSTGFIGSKLGAPYSEPFTFLMVRFWIAAALMGVIALMLGARWPKSPARFGHAVVVGVLIHGLYLGGVFWAIDGGVSAGLAALIVSLQPLVTGLAAGPVLGERVTFKQWAGLGLGFAGVAMVVWQQLDISASELDAMMAGVLVCVLSMAGIAAGSIYQRKFCGAEDLRGHQTVQLGAAAIVMTVLSFSLESQTLDWTTEFIIALVWLACVMSVGTFTLLYALIRRGAASQVSSLFYMIPPVTALMAYFLFDEMLGALSMIGMAVTVVGVALATRR